MDTALQLRIRFDHHGQILDDEIEILLKQSKTVQKLTEDYQENALFNLFRLVCLSEIPYAERLLYTQKVIAFISEHLALPQGFSYTGTVDYIVPCYNAMLMEAYTRLGKASSQEVQNALHWIKQYQVFERNQQTAWKHQGIYKHGGCMNATPCYIGIGKTLRALITYAEFTDHSDKAVEMLIEKGIDYMLRHNMYRRLSNDVPISAHITDVMFPQAYMISLTDLVYIAGRANLWTDPRTNALKQLVGRKACGENSWKIDYIYSFQYLRLAFGNFHFQRRNLIVYRLIFPLLVKRKLQLLLTLRSLYLYLSISLLYRYRLLLCLTLFIIVRVIP